MKIGPQRTCSLVVGSGRMGCLRGDGHPIHTRHRRCIMPQRKGSPVNEDGLTTKITEDTRRLSTNPRAIRHRIRRNGQRAAEDIALLHEVQYGEVKPVEEWTLEELQHGR